MPEVLRRSRRALLLSIFAAAACAALLMPGSARAANTITASGTVTDSVTHAAVSDAGVEMIDMTSGATVDEATTTLSGAYTLSDSSPTIGDKYVVYFNGYASGELAFAPQYFNNVTTEAAATKVTDSGSGGTFGTSVNAALTPSSGEIAGTVKNSSGPLAGAQVYLKNVDGQSAGNSVDTNASGYYSLYGIDPGTYVVYVEPETATDAAEYVGATPDPYTAQQFRITVPSGGAGDVITGANVTLVPGVTVSGTVSLSGSGGVGDVEVRIKDASGGSLYNVETRDVITASPSHPLGSYTMSDVFPGTYYVDFDASDAHDASGSIESVVSQWYGAPAGQAGLMESNATAVSMTSAATVNQTLSPGGVISGIVTDGSTGQPVTDGGQIQVHTLSGIDVADAGIETAGGSQPVGSYEVIGLPPGSYHVLFQLEHDHPAVLEDGWYSSGTIVPNESAASPVSVAASVNTTLNATMPVAGSIGGQVTAGGVGVGGITVDAINSDGSSLGTATSASNGNWEIFGLVPGSYKIEFMASGSGYSTGPAANLGFQLYPNATSLAGATALTVTAGQETSGINQSLSAGGQVTGTVTNAAGTGLTGIGVDLEDASGFVLESTTTLSDGSYVLPSVPSGTYYVEFDPSSEYNNAYQVQYFGNKQVLASSTPVGVSAPSTTGGVNAVLGANTNPLAVGPTTTVSGTPSIAGNIPTISGDVKVGHKLTAKTSGWTQGATLSYQWFESGKAIKGATASSYTLVGSLYKKTITVKVTGIASGFNWLTQTSAASKKVAEGSISTHTPTVSGKPKVGDTLKASAAKWTKGTKLSYQWYASKKAIKGATKSSFKLGGAEKGKTVTVKVTGKLSGYKTVSKTSKATAKVA